MNFMFTREAFDAVRSDIVNFVERCDPVVGGYLCSIDLLAVWNKLDDWIYAGLEFFGWVGRLRARAVDRERYAYIILNKEVEDVNHSIKEFESWGLSKVEQDKYVVFVADIGSWKDLFYYIMYMPYGGVVGYGLGKYMPYVA